MAAESSTKKWGIWFLVTFIFAITAFILMLVAETRCNFIKFVSTGGTSEPIVREFGIWHYRVVNYIVSSDGNSAIESCHRYPDSTELDAAWKAARAFSILVFVFAIIAIIAKCSAACSFIPVDPYGSGSSGIVAPLCLLLGIFQGGLTFLLLDSNACNDNTIAQVEGVTFEDQCSLSAGAELSISAMVFWLVAGVTSILEGKAWQSECEERRLARSSVLPEADSQATIPSANHGFLKRASDSAPLRNKGGVNNVGVSTHSNAESQATDLTEPLSPSTDFGFLRRASSSAPLQNREREVPDESSVPSEAESQAADLMEPSANYGFLRRVSSSAPSRNREGAISGVGSVGSEVESLVTDLIEPLVPTADYGFLRRDSSSAPSRNRGREVPDGSAVPSEAESQAADLMEPSANYGFLKRASSSVPSRSREGVSSDVSSVLSEAEPLGTDLMEPLVPTADYGFLRRASSGVPSRSREGAISDVGSALSEAEPQVTDLTEPLVPSASHGFLEEI